MKPNADYIIKKLQKVMLASKKSNDTKCLDFGCGIGEVVDEACIRGINMYGADTFEGYYSDWSSKLPPNLKERIKKITDNRIDFDDDTFDYVVSNQVFEHIKDPLPSMSEIARVLKPGGVFLVIFPNKSCWYEGHIGLYFPHWFKANSYLQYQYVKLSYFLGFGRKRHMGVDGWMHVLNNVTFHHYPKNFHQMILKVFQTKPDDIMSDYLSYRIDNSKYSRFKFLLEFFLTKKIIMFLGKIRAGSTLRIKNKK
jgi:SAM-dependent methyltransferase